MTAEATLLLTPDPDIAERLAKPVAAHTVNPAVLSKALVSTPILSEYEIR